MVLSGNEKMILSYMEMLLIASNAAMQYKLT